MLRATHRLQPSALALGLAGGDLVEVRAVEDDYRGGWFLATILEVRAAKRFKRFKLKGEPCPLRSLHLPPLRVSDLTSLHVSTPFLQPAAAAGPAGAP